MLISKENCDVHVTWLSDPCAPRRDLDRRPDHRMASAAHQDDRFLWPISTEDKELVGRFEPPEVLLDLQARVRKQERDQ